MAKITYKTIKAMKKRLGFRSVNDLFVQANINDPFYCGAPSQVRDAEWFAEWFHKLNITGPIHLRGIHYKLVSQREPVQLPRVLTRSKPEPLKTDVYINKSGCWEFLNTAAKFARYLGLVSIDAIEDKKNPEAHSQTDYTNDRLDYWISVPELESPSVWADNFSISNVQPYHLEVWCEKSTMDRVLMPVCSRYKANLVTFSGYSTISAVRSLIKRIEQADKPTRIFYVCDHDPAGMNIPVSTARELEWQCQHYDLQQDIRLTRIVLTPEQVERYHLPVDPEVKKDDQNFIERYGGCTELDALEALMPGELASIVGDALSEYYSEGAAREARSQKTALVEEVRSQVESITADYAEQIAALEEMIERLDAIEVDTSNFQVERYKPHLTEGREYLFNSGREYLDQLLHYKQYKNGGGHA